MISRAKNDKERPVYRLRRRDYFQYGGSGAAATFQVILIFYHSPGAAAAEAVIGMILFPLYKRKDVYQRQKREITLEFKESLYGISTHLRAGESLESAFENSVHEMDRTLFPWLMPEWNTVVSKMRLHRRLEDLLGEFAERTQIDEIMSFAEIIKVSKRTRGDITTVIENTSVLLQEKIEMQQELEVLLARKKTEQSIMNLMPLLVTGLLTMLSPDYVAPLYTTLSGRLIMTVCVSLSVLSIYLSRRMADISI